MTGTVWHLLEAHSQTDRHLLLPSRREGHFYAV